MYFTAMSNAQVERHFFGASYGKSLSDGEGAVAKKILSQAVRTESSFIDSAEAVVSTLDQYNSAPDQIHPTHISKVAVLVSDIKRPKLNNVATI